MQAERQRFIKLCSGTKGWGLSSVVVSAAVVSMSTFTGVNWKGLSDDDSYESKMSHISTLSTAFLYRRESLPSSIAWWSRSTQVSF